VRHLAVSSWERERERERVIVTDLIIACWECGTRRYLAGRERGRERKRGGERESDHY